MSQAKVLDRLLQATQQLPPKGLGAITNPIGSILSGVVAEYFGRKRSIQISSVPFILGWLCIGLADNIHLLYVGRLVTGVAAGMSSACYTYVSEVSTPENRGIFQTLGPICASFGILLTYTLGYFLNWATVAFLSVVFSIFTPETTPKALLVTCGSEETWLWPSRKCCNTPRERRVSAAPPKKCT
ncbi:hypothetical protein GEV33_004945 [Tenebrio molitor]|uniref:Major facilitator superfamily (MFS) profile domain-containing protein n=1 Tax=Tenebrio molitor TaxID=7067 RepID=A0A8J6HME0_TENMO|nr:hypothetical protein GEV33_004945 [Tenebrio molitor]